MPEAEAKFFTKDLLQEILRTLEGSVSRGVSTAASSQTVTASAPGAGKKLHVVGLIAYYSDDSDNELTINYTKSGAKTLTVKTGAGQVALSGIDIATDENTAVSVDAPAGAAGVTSTVQLVTYEEDLGGKAE